MLLAITALGYASVWVEGTLLAAGDAPARLLGVPEDKRLQIILPMIQVLLLVGIPITLCILFMVVLLLCLVRVFMF